MPLNLVPKKMWPEYDRKSLHSTSSQHHLLNQSRNQLTDKRDEKTRAIDKNGNCNIHRKNLSKLRLRFLQDIFTSMVDIKWRWCLVIFALAYFSSWLFFALIWWLLLFTHGDLQDEHLPQSQAESSWTPCVLNIHNFTSCYLYSIETQYTIGYGSRTITEECPQAIFIMSMQSIIGMTIDAFFLGIIFAKMTRAKLGTKTVLFSKNATIAIEDGELCLIFRICDMRKSPLIGFNVRAQLIKPKLTKEEEMIENYMTELELKKDPFFIWPMTIVHVINGTSPFYQMSPLDFAKTEMEIVVFLEATVASTGQNIQCRSSYVPNEILWGYRFEPILFVKDEAYDVNYSNFNHVYPVDIPFCSAADLDKGWCLRNNVEVSGARNAEDSGDDGPSKPTVPKRKRMQEDLITITSSYV